MSQMNPLGLIGALDPLSIGIDLGAQLLGLPPEVKNAAKIVVGVMTGDIICAANGAIGLMGNMAETAQTEWKPPEYSVASQGYAPSNSGNSTYAPSSGGSSATSGWTSQGGGNVGSSQPGCQPADPKGARLSEEDRQWYAAWSALYTNFPKAETAGGWALRDNFLTWTDIQGLANRTDLSPEMRDAVGFMLEHRDRFHRETFTRGSMNYLTGQHGVDPSDVLLIVREGERRGAFEAPSSGGNPTGGGCVGPVGGGTPGTGGAGGAGGAGSSSGGGCGPGGVTGGGPAGGQDPIDGIMADPTLSTQEKVEMILMEIMASLDQEALGLLDKMRGVRKQQAKAGDDQEKAADLASDMQMLEHKLQKVVERKAQMSALLTNLSRMAHESAMQAVNNMRS